MEDSVKEQQQPAVVASGGLGKSKLRYPLRSATKPKEEKAPVAELSNASVSRRGRAAATVSKSVGVLDLSGKEKSAKPPRRLSIPAKSQAGSVTKPVGNITPISEARSIRSNNGHGRNETPISDVSRASNRKKFNALSSPSYWMQQIKLSEAVAKHSVSLGFFKLALEAGCEPLQRLREELKSYVRRHELGVLGESVKQVFECYDISENQEQLQVSETCSQVPEEVTRSSDDEVHSSSSTMGTRKLRPRSLNADASKDSTVAESGKKATAQKTATATATRTRVPSNKNSANTKPVSDTAARKLEKKPQRVSKAEANKGKDKVTTKQGKKLSATEEGSVSPSAATNIPEENKENMDTPRKEETGLTEVH